MTQAIIETRRLGKKYRSQWALQDFELQVFPGEILGIAGPNGAGKTTLFRIITGLIPQYQGEVSLFGSTDKASLSHNRHHIGTIIEDPAFIPEMSGRENLVYFSIQRGYKHMNRIDDMLDLVSLGNTGKKKVKNYSLGMRQRLAIALALVHQPQILILDEPTNGLDPNGIVEVRELLKKLVRTTDLTIIVSSHILSELEHLATRFIIVNKGQKIEEFTKEELYQKTQNHYEITVNSFDKAISLLKEKYGDFDYSIDDNHLMRLYLTHVPLAEINHLLVSNGYQVSHLSRNKHELESLFMELTGGGMSHVAPNEK